MRGLSHARPSLVGRGLSRERNGILDGLQLLGGGGSVERENGRRNPDLRRGERFGLLSGQDAGELSGLPRVPSLIPQFGNRLTSLLGGGPGPGHLTVGDGASDGVLQIGELVPHAEPGVADLADGPGIDALGDAVIERLMRKSLIDDVSSGRRRPSRDAIPQPLSGSPELPTHLPLLVQQVQTGSKQRTIPPPIPLQRPVINRPNPLHIPTKVPQPIPLINGSIITCHVSHSSRQIGLDELGHVHRT
ncbi:MAG TPA: hypothetical protein VHV74_22625 [Pseudonocardiaceae bacterium]|nr:hypothetical protein [Pseudonocardiaceae bacterium]